METFVWAIIFITAIFGYIYVENKINGHKLGQIDKSLEAIKFQERMENALEVLIHQKEMGITAFVEIGDTLNYTDSTVGKFLVEALEIEKTSDSIEAIDELLDIMNSTEFRKSLKNSFSIRGGERISFFPCVTIKYVDKLNREIEFRRFFLDYSNLKKMKKYIKNNIEF